MNIVVIFSDGSREQFNNVDDKYREDVKGFIAIVKQKFPNKKIADIKYPKLGAPVAPATTEPDFVQAGDKNRWENLGGGYWHNLDTHEVRLR